MLKGIISKLITTFLDEFMKPVSSEQVTIEALKGISCFTYLEFQEKALQKFNLPFTVERSQIGKLYLKFPWTKLDTAPTIITIENVFIILSFDWNFFVNMSEIVTKSPKHPQKARDDFKAAFGVIDRIIDNFQLHLKNVHIRLKFDVADGTSVFGFVLPSLEILSSDKMVLGNKSFFSKILEMLGMYMYLDFIPNTAKGPETTKKMITDDTNNEENQDNSIKDDEKSDEMTIPNSSSKEFVSDQDDKSLVENEEEKEENTENENDDQIDNKDINDNDTEEQTVTQINEVDIVENDKEEQINSEKFGNNEGNNEENNKNEEEDILEDHKENIHTKEDNDQSSKEIKNQKEEQPIKKKETTKKKESKKSVFMQGPASLFFYPPAARPSTSKIKSHPNQDKSKKPQQTQAKQENKTSKTNPQKMDNKEKEQSKQTQEKVQNRPAAAAAAFAAQGNFFAPGAIQFTNQSSQKSAFIAQRAKARSYIRAMTESMDRTLHNEFLVCSDLIINITHNRKKRKQAMNQLEAILEKVTISFDRYQLEQLSAIYQKYQQHILKKFYRNCKKPEDTENFSKMFMFTYRCARARFEKPTIDVPSIIEFLKKRKSFYTLYSEHLTKGKQIFSNAYEKFEAYRKTISPKARRLLYAYSKAMMIKKEMENIKSITEEEKKALQKGSEAFLQSLSSFHLNFRVDNFKFYLLDRSQPKIILRQNANQPKAIQDQTSQKSKEEPHETGTKVEMAKDSKQKEPIHDGSSIASSDKNEKEQNKSSPNKSSKASPKKEKPHYPSEVDLTDAIIFGNFDARNIVFNGNSTQESQEFNLTLNGFDFNLADRKIVRTQSEKPDWLTLNIKIGKDILQLNADVESLIIDLSIDTIFSAYKYLTKVDFSSATLPKAAPFIAPFLFTFYNMKMWENQARMKSLYISFDYKGDVTDLLLSNIFISNNDLEKQLRKNDQQLFYYHTMNVSAHFNNEVLIKPTDIELMFASSYQNTGTVFVSDISLTVHQQFEIFLRTSFLKFFGPLFPGLIIFIVEHTTLEILIKILNYIKSLLRYHHETIFHITFDDLIFKCGDENDVGISFAIKNMYCKLHEKNLSLLESELNIGSVISHDINKELQVYNDKRHYFMTKDFKLIFSPTYVKMIVPQIDMNLSVTLFDIIFPIFSIDFRFIRDLSIFKSEKKFSFPFDFTLSLDVSNINLKVINKKHDVFFFALSIPSVVFNLNILKGLITLQIPYVAIKTEESIVYETISQIQEDDNGIFDFEKENSLLEKEKVFFLMKNMNMFLLFTQNKNIWNIKSTKELIDSFDIDNAEPFEGFNSFYPTIFMDLDSVSLVFTNEIMHNVVTNANEIIPYLRKIPLIPLFYEIIDEHQHKKEIETTKFKISLFMDIRFSLQRFFMSIPECQRFSILSRQIEFLMNNFDKNDDFNFDVLIHQVQLYQTILKEPIFTYTNDNFLRITTEKVKFVELETKDREFNINKTKSSAQLQILDENNVIGDVPKINEVQNENEIEENSHVIIAKKLAETTPNPTSLQHENDENQDGDMKKKKVVISNSVSQFVLSKSEDEFPRTTKAKEKTKFILHINLASLNIIAHPAVFSPILVYLIAESPFTSLDLPIFPSLTYKLGTEIEYDLPNIQFNLNKTNFSILFPTKKDLSLYDESFSMEMQISASLDFPHHFDLQFLLQNVRFINPKQRFDFPQMISALSFFLIVNKGDEKSLHKYSISAGLDKDFICSISSEDIFSLIQIVKDWSALKSISALFTGNSEIKIPKFNPPMIDFTTRNIVLQVCNENNNTSKQNPFFRLAIPPIGCKVVSSLSATSYNLVVKWLCEAYNKNTGNFDVVIEENSLFITITVATMKSKLKNNEPQDQNENFAIDAFVEIEKPLVVNISEHFMKQLFDIHVNMNRHTRNVSSVPDFWIRNSCNQEIYIDIPHLHVCLQSGDIIPAFDISNNTEIVIKTVDADFTFKPDDLHYPLQLTKSIIVSKHAYDNGLMVEFAPFLSIRNHFNFMIYVFIQIKKDEFALINGIPPSEMKEIPLLLGNYLLLNTSTIPNSVKSKPKCSVLGLTQAYINQAVQKQTIDIKSKHEATNVTIYMLDESKKEVKENSALAILRNDEQIGSTVIELRPRYLLKNMLPSSMQYLINSKYTIRCKAGETVELPFIEHNSDYLSMTSSYTGDAFPAYQWIYFKRDYGQMISVNYDTIFSTNLLAVFPHIDPYTSAYELIVYSPSIIFNTTIDDLIIDDIQLPPGMFLLYCPKNYFSKPDNVKCSVMIPNRTKKASQIIDAVSAGINEQIMLQNNFSPSLYTPLKYISKRQTGEFTRTVCVTVTDAIKIENQMNVSISLVPETEDFSIVHIDPFEFLIKNKETKMLRVISDSKKYALTISGYASTTIVDFSAPGEYVFQVKVGERRKIISMKIVDENICTVVYFKDSEKAPFLIQNGLTVDILLFQESRKYSTLIRSHSVEPFALDNPLGNIKITAIIEGEEFGISLTEACRNFTLDKVFNQKRVYIYMTYKKGQRIITFRDTEIVKRDDGMSTSVSIAIHSFGISLINKHFIELTHVSANGIDIRANLTTDAILCSLTVDSFRIDDQNPTASHPALLRTENRKFFEMSAILPLDFMHSKELIYLGVQMQPIHIHVTPMFISDIASFFYEFQITTKKSSEQGTIAPVTHEQMNLLTTSIHVIWLEIFQIEIFFCIHEDSVRQNFYEQTISLLSKIPNLTEKHFFLPAFFVSDLTSPIFTIGKELIGDYTVNGLDYALSNMGALGTFLKFIGVIGAVRSYLQIGHSSFTPLTQIPSKTRSNPNTFLSNRNDVYGVFNQYTLERLFNHLIVLKQLNPTSPMTSLCEFVIRGENIDVIKVRKAGLESSYGTIGTLKYTPSYHQNMMPPFRERAPLCCMMNRIESHNEQLAWAQNVLLTSGYGRALFYGLVGNHFVFITKTHVCLLSDKTKVIQTFDINLVDSVSETNKETHTITLDYNEKSTRTGQYTKQNLTFESQSSGSIVLFLSANKPK